MEKFAAKWPATLPTQPLTIALDAKKPDKYDPLALFGLS